MKINVLILMLTVSLCAIMLSAGCTDSAGNPNTVPVETAYNQTLSTFWSYPIDSPDVTNVNWTSASLDPKPTIIYDVKGEPLYYEFYLRNAQGIPGYSWTAANKLLGITVFRIYPGSPSWNHSQIAQDAEKIVKTRYPDYPILSNVPALYGGDYLTLCRMLMIRNTSSGASERIIVDAITLEIIPDNPSDAYKSHKYAWSYLDSVPHSEYPDRVRVWEMDNSNANMIVEYAVAQGINVRLPLSEQNASIIRKYRALLSSDLLSPESSRTLTR